MSTDTFRLLMISAMYENGGNTTHRLFDGHPELFVYPFESQLGTRLVADHLSSLFPLKYRWPAFDLSATAEADYNLIIDEECKVRARTPQVSKFRHITFDFNDDERRVLYGKRVELSGRSRGANVAAFFQATFDAWKNVNRSGREAVYVGYSPVVVVDALRILEDLPAAHVLHVVRNPWSAYADTKKRPVPLTLEHYTLAWVLNQYLAVQAQLRFPERLHIVRLEDILANPVAALTPICQAIGVAPDQALNAPSWNGQALDQVYPWGTIRAATSEANRATAAELSDAECEAVHARCAPYLAHFAYTPFPR